MQLSLSDLALAASVAINLVVAVRIHLSSKTMARAFAVLKTMEARLEAERGRRMDAEARARGVGGLAGAPPSIRRVYAPRDNRY